MNKAQNKSLLILGAGPGGYTAALYGAKLGFSVTLVDPKEAPGGVCLHQGCIPSKALLHAAKIISDSKDATLIGINFGQPDIDINKIRDWKNNVVTKLSSGLQNICKQKKVKYIQGKASFVNSNAAKVEKPDGSRQEIQFEHAILATGSKPATLLPLEIQSPRILDSSSALDLGEIPEKLLVIGGGYIGLELATVYAALGSKISIVEMMPSILPGVDTDLTRILERRIKNIFESIRVNTKVTKIQETESGIVVTFEDKNGNNLNGEYNKVLVAIGRKPNTEGLSLENTKVEVDKQGFVKVALNRQTADPKIYAIGDITGNPMLAHKAMAEAPMAIEAIAGKETNYERAALPAVVFTDPEIAWCGLTETEAKAQNREVKVAKMPWSASGRATTMNRTDGMTKLIIDAKTEKILGVAIVGVGAGELISEGVLAIEKGATATDLARTIHPHPTLSETLMETAANLFK